MTQFVQITTTTGDYTVADRIASVLVDDRLAACVQVAGPMKSTYRWQGKPETAEEWVCTAKCREDRFDEVAEKIAELHPYDVPEIIATPILAARNSYAAWMRGELG